MLLSECHICGKLRELLGFERTFLSASVPERPGKDGKSRVNQRKSGKLSAPSDGMRSFCIHFDRHSFCFELISGYPLRWRCVQEKPEVSQCVTDIDCSYSTWCFITHSR